MERPTSLWASIVRTYTVCLIFGFIEMQLSTLHILIDIGLVSLLASSLSPSLRRLSFMDLKVGDCSTLSHIFTKFASALFSIGVVGWLFPNTDDIYIAGGFFAKALASITPTVLSPSASYAFSNNTDHTLEAGLWLTSSRSVLMVTNIQHNTATMAIDMKGMDERWNKIFESGSGSSLKQEGRGYSVTLTGYNTVIYVAK